MNKYYEKLLTKKLSPILNNLGVDHLTRSLYAGRGQILKFHRVIPTTDKERIHNHLSLEISPEQLRNIIFYFKTRNYDFISLDLLPEWLIENSRTKRKFVILTFDDGYKDNLTFAYPILKEHNVPFTIYVTNSFPDKTAIIWWYILEDIINRNEKIQFVFSEISVNIDCSNYKKKEMAFSQLREIVARNLEKNTEEELTGFFSKYGYSTSIYNQELTLDWNEIVELSHDLLVTIGAHTMNHYNLCSLSKEQSYFEIEESKKQIEAFIHKEVKHFCYPLGKFGVRELEFLEKCDYLTATTTQTANIFDAHLDHLLALPRISVNVLTTEHVLDLQVNGFFPAILNHFKRVIY